MIILPETEGMLVERRKVRQIVCPGRNSLKTANLWLAGRRSIQEREPESGPL
jgi:hypothetical protein